MNRMMMNKNMLKAALGELRLNENEVTHVEMRREDDLTYMSFYTLWMWYELYLDAQGNVLGLNMEPVTDRAELAETNANVSAAA